MLISEENKERMENHLMEVIEELGNYEPGSKEYSSLKAEMDSLTKVLNDDHKLLLEERQQTYQSLKDTVEEKERRVDRWIKAGLGILGTGASVFGVLANWRALKLALGFETNGTFRSKAGLEALRRALTNRL